MKKVLSFCVFSVLLAMFSLSTKAQGGVCCVTMTPSSFPTTIVLDSVYTFDLHPFLGCIDESTKISLEWELYRNGVIIPQDSLTSYLNEFRFQTKIVNGENVTWVGDDYTSNYCDDGDGRGSYPGAYTPVNGVGDCARNGYFSILGAGGQNNPDFFDFFYAKFFQDPVNTAHRLRVNFKEDGDYSIVINIHERIGGTTWDHFVGNDERYKIGGHQSVLGDLIQSDSLSSIDYDTIAPVTICVGSSFTFGDSTYYSSGVYDATFTSPSECSGVIYRIVHFELIVDNPKIPILDLNNSQIQICEDGIVTLTAIPVDGGTCIWYDNLNNPIDTALSIHPMITNNTTFYVVSYNDLSDCISPDTLQVYVEHYNSPIPNLLTNPTNGIICAEQNMNIYLDHRYTTQNWLLNGNAFAATDTVHYITNAVTTDGGRYRVNVSELHTHAVYTTNTLSCYGADSVDVVVNELPVVTLNPDTLITCAGTPVQFNATSPTATNYTWNPGTFLNDQYIAAPTFGAIVPNPYISGRYIYSIRVQDENGCSSHRDTMTVIVNALPVVTVTTQYPEVCLLRNTDTLIFGGAVDYIWTDGVTTDTVTENVQVLPIVTTTYNVTGTDANGCTNTASTSIIVYPEETIAFDYTTLDTTYCQNTTPVVLPATDMNGISGTWSPEAISTTTVGTADYTFTPDPARCADPVTITVRTYELPVITISQFNAAIFTPALDITIADFVCPNAGDQVVYNNISNGLAPYTTTWFGVDAFDNTLGKGTVNIATTCNTPYAVKVITTDANGCVAKDTAGLSFTVNDVDAPVITQLLNTVEAAPSLGGVCGYIVPDVRTAAYFTATDNCSIVDTVQTPAAGTIIYEEQVVTVTISDMCGNTDNITVNVTIPAHVAVRDSLLSMELCPGNQTGSIRVWASQGIAPYEVVLKDRDRDTIVNTVASTNDSCDFIGLTAMNYKVVVTDRNGCKDSTVMYVGAPDALRYTGVDTTMVACFGESNGEIIFDVAGGTQPYYLDIKKDGAAFDLDTTGTNLISYRHTMSNLFAGVYDITITDDNGCTLNSLITIVEPALLEITNISVLNNVQCNGTATGNAQVVVNGGNDAPNYNYYWIAAGTTDTVSRTATTGRILPVGNYNVYVYDVKGCTVNSAVTITEPTLMVLDGDTIVKPTALCTRTGSFEVSVLVTGGTTPYTYTWGNDAAGLANNATVQISEILPINCNRTYTASVEIRDDSNCLINRTTQFVVSDVVNPVITGTIDTTEIFNTVCTFADAGDTARTVADLLALPNHGLTIGDNCTAQEALIVEHSETTTGTCQKIITRTYTIKDLCDNFATVEHVIVITDNEAPTFTKPADITLFKDNNCNANVTIAATGDVTNEHDNCTATLEATHSDRVVPGCAGVDTIYRTWSLEDACHNQAPSQVQIIAVKDTTRPYFTTIPKDTIIDCDGIGNVADLNAWLANVSAEDRCDVNVLITNNYSVDNHVAGCGNTFSVSVTWYAEDNCGNIATTSATFTVQDTVIPFFTIIPDNAIVNCDIANFDDLFLTWRSNVAYNDNCDTIVNLTWDSRFTQACGNTGNYVVRFYAEDRCGNRAVDSSNFTIIDVTAPVFDVIPVDDVVQCDGAGNILQLKEWLRGPHATDLCDPDLVLTHNCDTIGMHPDGIHFAGYRPERCGGYYDVIWTATDACGNRSTTRERFTIRDTEGPTFDVAPQNKTVQCGSGINIADTIAEWLLSPRISDVCAPVPTLTNDYAPANFVTLCGNTGYVTVTWTAKDTCDNPTIASARFTVIDTVRPVITGTLIQDTVYQTANCREFLPAPVNTVGGLLALGGITDVDGCNITNNSPVVRLGNDELIAGSTDCVHYYRRTYQVRDNCYNTSHLSTNVEHIIVVLDTIHPKVVGTLPELTVYLNDDAVNCDYTLPTPATTLAQLPELTITDCHRDSIAAVSEVEYGNGIGCDRYVTRTYTIADQCGNDTLVYQNIRIVDNTAPRIAGTLINDTVQLTADCVATIPDAFATVADVEAHAGNMTITDCNITDGTSVTLLRTDNSTNQCPKIVTRYYEVNDACGNHSEFTHVIVVEDNVTPTITGELSDLTIYMDAECNYTLPTAAVSVTELIAVGGITAITDCNLNPVVTVNDVQDNNNTCDRFYTRTYTVKDSCGNETTTVQT
ncbi:MAG TPA: hypothetical protein PK740_00765, partial [Bacteroidales bacterium]|nr:hypothetical protein [Bacteroidales bacterium]